MLFTFDVRNTNGILMPIDGLSQSNMLLHENMLQKIFMNTPCHTGTMAQVAFPLCLEPCFSIVCGTNHLGVAKYDVI